MKYEGLIKTLAFLAVDNVYGPIDRMARAIDTDMVRVALYEALRYLSSELHKCIEAEEGKRVLEEEDRKRCKLLKELTNLTLPEDEVKVFLDDLEKRGVGIARRVAIEALTLGLKKKGDLYVKKS